MTLLLYILVVLLLLGLCIWLVRQAPFDPMIRWLMMAVAVVAAIWAIASKAGVA